ncbi:hypothetical protein [Streptomyces sp. NPDC005281]|uniref:hypothetical protein n=1 Tax=Streptomyces sp. NPDC005281 TaxID=3155712 RepID=UPI0033BAED49
MDDRLAERLMMLADQACPAGFGHAAWHIYTAVPAPDTAAGWAYGYAGADTTDASTEGASDAYTA